MRKTEKNEIINAETIAYYSGFGGIEIKSIDGDFVVFVSGTWCGKKSVHRAKVYYSTRDFYFLYNGNRIKFGECLRA